MDSEEMLVEGGVACSELGDDGGLAAVEIFNELEVFLGGEGVVDCIEEGVAGRGLPASLSASLDGREVGLA